MLILHKCLNTVLFLQIKNTLNFKTSNGKNAKSRTFANNTILRRRIHIKLPYMNLEIEGKVVQLLEEQTGQGRNGAWVKQEVIIETEEQYPRKICLACWGDKAAVAKALQPGERIKAGINIESREFNGRWYTDVKAWRIDRTGAAQGAAQAAPPAPSDMPYEGEDNASPEDDLPF